MTSAFVAGGSYREERAANLLDGGMPFYDLYETSDGRHVSVGPLEPQFYDVFVGLLELTDAPDRYDSSRSEELREQIAARFATRTLAEWTEVFEGTDACVAPVLTMSEAAEHPHMAAREVYVEHEGIRQPAPAPRFSRTPGALAAPPAPKPGAHTREALQAWGIDDVDGLLERGSAVQA
jgi:alpha-methylacyl-CoA racemase